LGSFRRIRFKVFTKCRIKNCFWRVSQWKWGWTWFRNLWL